MAPEPGVRRVLDVRTIDGPPFGPITDALEALPEDGVLVIVSSFEPVPLYEALEKRGFDHETLRVDQQEWRVHITHAGTDIEPEVEA